MKFKLDENMPGDLAVLLRTQGHDAMGVVEQGLAGEDDPPVLERAASEDRILMTFDLDFADDRHYRPGTHAGIIVFRLRDQTAVFSHFVAAWLLLMKYEFAGNGPKTRKKANRSRNMRMHYLTTAWRGDVIPHITAGVTV